MDAALVLPRIDRAVCTGCGDCVGVCHTSALAIQDRVAVFVSPGGCDYCTDCEAVCAVSAITCPFQVLVLGDNSALAGELW
jgi:ferredoxin